MPTLSGSNAMGRGQPRLRFFAIEMACGAKGRSMPDSIKTHPLRSQPSLTDAITQWRLLECVLYLE